MAVELTITIKDSECKLQKKFLEYDKFYFDRGDPLLMSRIEECINEFNGDKEDMDVRISARLIIK